MTLLRLVIGVALACVAAGCRQKMAEQPSYRPLEPSSFFGDGQSARPLPAGTIARGHMESEIDRYAHRQDANAAASWAGIIASANASAFSMLPAVRAVIARQAMAQYEERFPFPVTAEALERGRERYAIFCAVCHGSTGDGDGPIVQRGYTRPPSFHSSWSRGLKLRGARVPLRDVPAGYYFEVATKGFGAMPDYSTELSPADRWRVIAYIRALQLSRNVRLTDLPADEREKIASRLEGGHE